ncbi:serine/threonine-protein kinase pim-1-like [Danio aesculapii]|uniref:serine/threonine-protein kinase pim-1-like n=1 Tax=Danio aesculapii TaxID=1142201 RepID=UPI0024C06869|nr:serine/threonine-protein kinase pim-1-like [Danio aesculapii]
MCFILIYCICFQDVKKDIVLVMEHPGPCRTLEDFLKEKQHMEERDARTLILQIVKAAQECLRREICHWDIHEDNILVIGPPLQIKLIDFGQGTRIGDRQVHQWPGRRISFKEAVKITVNQLYYLMKEMAKHCSSIPAEFMRFMATCWSPVNAEDQIQHTVEEILNQPWLKD